MTLNVIAPGPSQCDAKRPNVVFLHGWGLSARIWEPLADRLAPSLRCHLVDLPSHGASPGGYAGLNNWVDAVVQAAVQRIVGPAVYVGWSLGGRADGQRAKLARRARRACAFYFPQKEMCRAHASIRR